ncbi:hypothetical protein J2Z76_002641 [Sedimentibacter acidaminivorans]|uniref:ATPase n=1 Tax=Sedimentibacter acidaminivorans TaxID=913099 RepID=A0ABS4GGF2_9FIRM|nr:hypothetical protein [Sedimentibacter acidaminivorans]MBP1926771.1 hypothetical protein [Sedimentibacter acidaminivorans]
MLEGRHVFAGSNSSKGFFSYFDHIIKPENANRIYILKGGPGVGKSSFIKKFGIKISSLGHEVEYIHCSSDENSLDGLVVPDLKIAFVDGTAPHLVDPKLPGAADEIINLGAYLDNSNLEKHKEQIIKINKSKSELYKSAYRYLESAGLISEEINSIYDRYIDDTKFDALCDKIIDKLFAKKISTSNTGSIRKMFSEAYTSNGYIKYTDYFCSDSKTWVIIGESSNYTSKLLDRIVQESVNKGYYTECFYKPLTPEKIQHVIIPELNLLFKSDESAVNCNYDEIINLHEIMDLENMKSHISEIESNLHLLDLLIKNALNKLSETAKYHQLLEVFYVNSMNFSKVDKYLENILSKYA